MRVLLRAFDPLCEEANHAIVKLDIDRLLELRELLQMVRSKDEGISEIVVWAEELNFYSDHLDKELEDELKVREWILITDEVEVGEGEIHSSDNEMVLISTNHVYWRATAPHGPGDYSTTGLSWEELAALKGDDDASR